MYIWFGFVCAKDKESLMREEKVSNIVEVRTFSEFRHWLGEMFCKAYELYGSVDNQIEANTAKGEDAYAKLRHNSKFNDLIDFTRRQIKEAQKENPLMSVISVECGKDYHDLVDAINETNGFAVGGIQTHFSKVDEDGIYRKASVLFGMEHLEKG